MVAIAAPCVNAQVLTNTWTLAGGGLNPTNYGGSFRPATLASDAGSTGTATIAMSGLTSGGLGSSLSGPYGGIYTFMSSNLTLTLQVTNLPANLDQVSLSFLAGGGNPTLLSYGSNSITLNYNPANSNLASSQFSFKPSLIVDTPFGPQTVTPYSWTWANLSTRGSASNFFITWGVSGTQHVFMTDIAVSQVGVPEPSIFALVGLGVVIALFMHRKSKRPIPEK